MIVNVGNRRLDILDVEIEIEIDEYMYMYR